MRRSLPVLLALACVSSSVVGCSGRLRAGVDNVDELLAATEEGDFAAAVAAGDAAWANRSEESAVLEAIAAWEGALTLTTDDEVQRTEAIADVYVKLSMAHYWLAHAHQRFIEDEGAMKEASMASYTRGMEAGQRGLAIRNAAWNEALTGGASAADSVGLLTDADVPAAYWYAANTGRWALLEGVVSALRFKDEIFALMTRVQELDGSYFYNGPDRYFGAYHTKLPLGNPNVELSAEHFNRAIEAAPDYLESRVVMAEEWATKTNNREAALEQLNFVVNFDLSTAPDLLPENTNAVRRAQIMLDEIDEYFR